VDAFRTAAARISDQPEKTQEQIELEALEAQLEAQRARTAAKAKAKADAEKPAQIKREIAFEEAKEKALDKYLESQLFTAEVTGVGVCLFHWPDEITYDHYMKGTGAIKGDLENMSADKIDNLIGRCAIFPDGPTVLKELREKNPHARTVIANQLFTEMKGKLAKEGK
jgi:hypothetical protein